MKAPNKIWHRHDGKYGNVKIAIGSQRLHAQLMRWGFTQNKSYDATPPEVLKYNRHFWRGVVDGDGYLGTTNDRKIIHLCGTKDMVEAFRTFLAYSGVNTDAQVAKTKGKELHTFCIAGKALPLGAAKLLYDRANYYLDRKHNEYLSWITD